MHKNITMENMKSFYEHHLKNDILPFWLRSSVDYKKGGYFNCYDNTGRNLVSKDKYTWSQGRFVWIFSKLASLSTNTFNDEERKNFLKIAKLGADFLMENCLLDNGNCAFLLDENGKPKLPPGQKIYDTSIFADCFVTAGLAKYALAASAEKAYHFARKLYDSIHARVMENKFHMEPYPTPKGYKTHSIPMILLNLSEELHEAAKVFEPSHMQYLEKRIEYFADDILNNFVDENNLIRETIREDNTLCDNILGRCINPGHTIEDMWFVITAGRIFKKDWYKKKAAVIVESTFKFGWDNEFDGIFHYLDVEGGPPKGNTGGLENEPAVRQLRNDWDNKLWWVHSEALYTTLLCYKETGDIKFYDMYCKVFDYTFSTFPNPDREIGEWIQIRERNGTPVEKVVALPVKDPYHIIRNIALIIELL